MSDSKFCSQVAHYMPKNPRQKNAKDVQCKIQLPVFIWLYMVQPNQRLS